MKNNEKLIAGLQAIVTGLSQQADGHAIQSRIFASQGFSKLEKKYAEHAEEERGYVNQIVDRMLDLEAEVKLEDKKSTPVCKDPVEWIKYDLQVSIDGLAFLKELIEESQKDYTTYDILKKYYQDEEEDMYWAQSTLELIDTIGKQNWLVHQL